MGALAFHCRLPWSAHPPGPSKARPNVEKVEGYRLSELVATYRQRVDCLPIILAVDWFEQAFRALAAIHATGRKYCSIGPDKVFIGADDSVRIDPAVGTNDFAGGDAAFTPPELLAGRAVDQRADLYGLGAVFYELLTLRCPGPLPDPPSSINITVPKGFDACNAPPVGSGAGGSLCQCRGGSGRPDCPAADARSAIRTHFCRGGGPDRSSGWRSLRCHGRRRRRCRRDWWSDCRRAVEFVFTRYDRRRAPLSAARSEYSLILTLERQRLWYL